MGLLGQPGDQDLVCHLIFVQSSFGIYESSCQNAQEAHNLGAINAFWHCTYFFGCPILTPLSKRKSILLLTEIPMKEVL